MLLRGKSVEALTTSAQHFVALTRSHQALVCLFFTAEWCEHCKRFAAVMNRPGVMFYRVDVDRMQGLRDLYRVGELPTFALVRDGVHIASLTDTCDLLGQLAPFL